VNIDPKDSGAVGLSNGGQTAMLNEFRWNRRNGVWTLYLADLSGGWAETVVSWVWTSPTVPEPQTWFWARWAGSAGGKTSRTTLKKDIFLVAVGLSAGAGLWWIFDFVNFWFFV